MKIFKSFLIEMILPFICAWFFMTVLVDVVAVPTVFRNVSKLQEAGKIGMTLFGKFNRFEIFFSLFIFMGTLSMKVKSKELISIATVLLVFSLFYTFYMTPLIANNSLEMHAVAITDPSYAVLKMNNTKYHVFYRYLDTTKLFVLLVFAGLVLRFNLKRMHKECV